MYDKLKLKNDATYEGINRLVVILAGAVCNVWDFSGTSLRTRRLVPIFYGKIRPAGAQTVWLLHFMLQMYATQQKNL